jgi:hypothetical protein
MHFEEGVGNDDSKQPAIDTPMPGWSIVAHAVAIIVAVVVLIASCTNGVG